MLLPLTNVAALTFMFSCMMVSLACYKMRSSEANLYRPYKVPGGKAGISAACCVSFLIIAAMLLPGTSASLSKTEYLVLTGWTALGLLVKSLHLYKKIRTAVKTAVLIFSPQSNDNITETLKTLSEWLTENSPLYFSTIFLILNRPIPQ